MDAAAINLGRSERRRRGFTLIEALAAGMILAVAAVVIGSGLSQGYAAMSDARDYRRAAQLLDELATKVDLIGPVRIDGEGPTQGRCDSPDDRFSWEITARNRPQGHLYEVTIRLDWTARGGKRSAELHTLINDPPGARDTAMRWDDL